MSTCFILTGQACIETGEAFARLAETKYTLEDNVKQNFLEPLHHLQSTELKEIAVSALYLRSVCAFVRRTIHMKVIFLLLTFCWTGDDICNMLLSFYIF